MSKLKSWEVVSEKVSILIPFKNTAAYLPACLDSIINQSYKNWEVLIVDDSSTDKSYQIAKKFKKVKIYKKKKKKF